MRVFVKNMRGEPLMPCTQRRARLLLKAGKARICKYHPFTIQLDYATGETKQDCTIGIDTGSKNIGIAVRSEDKVLFKGEVELRQDVKVHKKICFSDIGKVTAGSKGELYLYDLGGKRLIKAGGLVENFGLLEDDLGRIGKIGVGKTCKDQK